MSGIVYLCGTCGHQTRDWQRNCPKCKRWNSLQVAGTAGAIIHPIPVTVAAESPEPARLATAMGEFDRVLGGGMVRESIMLLAGEPGAGKSTLLAQISARIARRHGQVLYVTGEESVQQVALRARRVEAEDNRFALIAEQDIDRVSDYLQQRNTALLVVDSIQRVKTGTAPGATGSVDQVKASTSLLCNLAHATGTTVLLIGHVTKDGDLAGPKTMEHLVDVVLTLEVGEGAERILRATKNRYGSTLEPGRLTMTERGLQ